MKLSNDAYDVLAFIGRVVLPALSVLYATLGEIWGIPFTKEIPLTITAIDLFLNSLLGISTANYYKGVAEQSIVPEEDQQFLKVFLENYKEPVAVTNNYDTVDPEHENLG